MLAAYVFFIHVHYSYIMIYSTCISDLVATA